MAMHVRAVDTDNHVIDFWQRSHFTAVVRHKEALRYLLKPQPQAQLLACIDDVVVTLGQRGRVALDDRGR